MRCPAFFVNKDGTYTLDGKYTAQTLLKGHDAQNENCTLLPNGQLVINRGFVWDGPSGPAIDTANTLIPSAMHDALYGIISEQHLPAKFTRDLRNAADRSYRDSLKTWGVSKWRRMLHYRGVNLFGWLHI